MLVEKTDSSQQHTEQEPRRDPKGRGKEEEEESTRVEGNVTRKEMMHVRIE